MKDEILANLVKEKKRIYPMFSEEVGFISIGISSAFKIKIYVEDEETPAFKKASVFVDSMNNNPRTRGYYDVVISGVVVHDGML